MYLFIYRLSNSCPVFCIPVTSAQANKILDDLLKQRKQRVYLNCGGGELPINQAINCDQFILLECTQPGICVTPTIEGS